MKPLSFFILSLFFLSELCAQKVKASVDHNDILIGEQIQLKLQGNFLADETPSWFRIDTIPRFDILQKASIDTTKVPDGFVLSQTFVITSWDSGKIQLPAFQLEQWKTDPISINVAYSPSPFDTSQPYHEIRDILEPKKEEGLKWQWYVIFALVLIGLFLLFFPKGKKKEPGAFVSDEGAYKKALRKLEELRKVEGDSAEYYTLLIRILREYLHRRKNIYSFSKTTDDLGLQLRQLNIDRDQYAELLQTLRLSDLAKFARYSPSTVEKENSWQVVRNSIITIEQTPHVV